MSLPETRLQNVIMSKIVPITSVFDMGDNLEEQILNARKVAMNGSDVVYDLTSGVDFSKPRKTSEALAKVIFEKDVSSWVQTDGEKISVVPKTKLEIRILDNHNKAIEKTLKDFRKDMEYDELRTKYSRQIETAATYKAGVASYLFLGIGTSLLIQHMQRSEQKSEFVDELMSKLMDSITVTSLQ